MTGSQVLDAQEKREAIFKRDHWTCVKCGNSLFDGIPQLAHRIAKTKSNIKKYGLSVINHPINLVSVETSFCNDQCNIGFNTVETERVVEEIRDAMLKE